MIRGVKRRMLFYTVVVLLAFCIRVAAQSQKDIDSLLIKSESLVYYEPSKALVLNDFIFKEAKSVPTRTDALLLQAEAFETQLKYYEALQKIIEAKDFNYELDCNYCDANIYIHLSDIFRNINMPEQADEALQRALDLQSEENVAGSVRLKILLLLAQADRSKISNTEKLVFLKQAHVIFDKNKNSLHPGLKHKIDYLIASTYLKNGQPELAKERFEKLIADVSLSGSVDIYTVLSERQLGEIYFKEGALDKAVDLLTKNIDHKNFSPNIFLRNYEVLAEIYSIKKNVPLFAHYRELYIAKLNNQTQQEQTAKVLAISFYESSKQKESTDEKAAFKIKFMVMTCLFTAILLGLYIYYLILKKKQKSHSQFLHQKKQFEETIESMKTHYMEENTPVPFAISEKAELAILDKLTVFEKSELFTDQELSLKSLAKHLDTNTKYLSEIINSQKNKNFKTYINELRINYIVNKLQLYPEYRQYKTSHLANVAGFTSRSSFTVVFKSLTGSSPSVFIASLQDNQQ
ncbi:helix-turn-helix domain-containing protein [Flavobacterium sp. Sd200]|uniref:helix-turn-helix domain-containing protein n=1 Tax=Flavobacterium sp. Sd200 TaxID=2692211 RepID=UPI0013718B58|nr:helix-turn-helix domain-containing protein [Flavobacterium sp. Sd200]MXN90745.1 helix-turn-helix domain-containing protein [Flavobacterium sp. Sd200]